MSKMSPSSQPFSEWLSDRLQHAIKVVIGSNRKPPRRLKSFLNGTWFGHPLHPVITDVPITSWILTAVFDLIWLISPAHNTWAAYGAFVTVIVGLLGALGAVATPTGATRMVQIATSASSTRYSTRVRRFSTSSPFFSGSLPAQVMALLPP